MDLVVIFQVLGLVNLSTDSVEQKTKTEGQEYSWPAQTHVLWPVWLNLLHV